ncbi:MAG TPA: hypothetical protein PLT04_04490 [Candidatus Saccharibacteria bacterium]|nr:hypothetical protein [Candidatus Saccharibacteria bacterium]
MYAGSTLRALKLLDTWVSAHQKIDRIAYAKVRQHASEDSIKLFPNRKQILAFEGMDGPDGIKRKTPAQDEPWHFLNPHDEDDTQLLEIIESHYCELVTSLRTQNKTRAGFEAAWLAHAVVDGLTPAHHYPYEQELIRLRGGSSIESRVTPKEKILMHGDTISEKMKNNWQMWGDKGLLATHFAFEWGVTIIALPLRMSRVVIDKDESKVIESKGVRQYFQHQVEKIVELKLYERFYQTGWTPALAKTVRKELLPVLIGTLATIWYAALQEAQEKP